MNEGEPRRSLLAQPWVQTLALMLVVILAFGSNLEGELVWDDDLVIGAGAALPGPGAAFTADLFAHGSGPGARYYRPLVTLSYWLDVGLFTSAPNVGMHLVTLAWHVAAASLVLRVMRRWVPAPAGLAFAATALWAVLPAKAETAAWISGRGDSMGLVFALLGLNVALSARTPRAQAVAAAAGTALALLCKEAMVAAPMLFVGAALVEHAGDEAARGGPIAHLRRALLTPMTLASGAVTAMYLAVRVVALPIVSGGEAMIAAVPVTSKLVLFLETTGYAAVAVVTPWKAGLLRGPIAFERAGVLVHEPVMALLGAATWGLAVAAAWRSARARGPLVIALGAFLPVSNLISMGLEARLSDRFLYLPSVGVLLGLALAIAGTAPARATGATAVLLVATVFLGSRARARSELFASDDLLFGWEARHGQGAIAVVRNAALASAKAHRHREARDLHLRVSARYQELGFKGEGFVDVFAAMRNQVWFTEDTHRPSLIAFEQLLRAMLAGEARQVELPLDDGRVLSIHTASVEAQEYVAQYGVRMVALLGLIVAKRGDPEALELAARAVADCQGCRAAALGAAEIALASARPDLADEWLERVPGWEPRREGLAEASRAQRLVLDSSSPFARPLALFLGGAFRPACLEGGAIEPPPTGATRELLAAACSLAAEASRADAWSDRIPPAGLRHDLTERARLALTASGRGADP